MGVYIKGLAMPTGNHEITVRIQSDGRVLDQWGHRFNQELIAVPVPPHGRLIDADALRAEFKEPNEENGGWRNPDEALVHKTDVWAAIDDAPTIIEEGE